MAPSPTSAPAGVSTAAAPAAPADAGRRAPSVGTGLALTLLSTATFGTSGAFAASLLEAGWSSAAAVTARVALAAAVLTVPTLLTLRGRWHLLVRNWRPVVTYGVVAVAACQLFYFNAVERLDVAVALLLEYLGTVLVVGWMWARHGQRPRPLTVAGGATAVAGLTLVLDVLGAVRVDVGGVLWGLGAAVGLAVFFVISAHTDDGLPPLAMAWGASRWVHSRWPPPVPSACCRWTRRGSPSGSWAPRSAGSTPSSGCPWWLRPSRTSRASTAAGCSGRGSPRSSGSPRCSSPSSSHG